MVMEGSGACPGHLVTMLGGFLHWFGCWGAGKHFEVGHYLILVDLGDLGDFTLPTT